MTETELKELLQKGLVLEENFVVELVPFMRKVLAVSEIDTQTKEKIDQKITQLYNETRGHKKIVETLLKEVGK